MGYSSTSLPLSSSNCEFIWRIRVGIAFEALIIMTILSFLSHGFQTDRDSYQLDWIVKSFTGWAPSFQKVFFFLNHPYLEFRRWTDRQLGIDGTSHHGFSNHSRFQTSDSAGNEIWYRGHWFCRINWSFIGATFGSSRDNRTYTEPSLSSHRLRLCFKDTRNVGIQSNNCTRLLTVIM